MALGHSSVAASIVGKIIGTKATNLFIMLPELLQWVECAERQAALNLTRTADTVKDSEGG